MALMVIPSLSSLETFVSDKPVATRSAASFSHTQTLITAKPPKSPLTDSAKEAQLRVTRPNYLYTPVRDSASGINLRVLARGSALVFIRSKGIQPDTLGVQ